MTDENVLSYVSERMPDFEPTNKPMRLPEGNLNIVWRVPGRPASIIVKFAPPYIAANPDVPLDPSRLEFEARCLEVLAPGGSLEAVCTDRMRPPHPVDLHTDPHVLLMEDVGPYPALGRWLRNATVTPDDSAQVGRQVGRFIGRLHAATVDDRECAERFNNRAMQETRLVVQYEAVEKMLKTAGVEDAAMLGERAVALGRNLLQPGQCLTMGDLWPPSVLVVEDGLRIIDWELAHYGHPMQDIAHFAAHLWMQAHRAKDVMAAAVQTQDAVLSTYREALGNVVDRLLTPQTLADGAVHFGAEILVRTVGPFQAGYLYEGLAPETPAVQEAVDVAAAHIRYPDRADTFNALRRVSG